MGTIGKIIKTKIETFILNTVEKRFSYNINGETYGPSGDDSPGLNDDRVCLVEIDGKGRSVVVGNLTISQGANPGEKILYSRDENGNVKAKIYIKNDGAMDIEGVGGDVNIFTDNNLVLQQGTDFAMRFNEFKTQIDQMKSDYDNFINITFNTHTHPGVQSGGSSTGTPAPTGSGTSSDFTNVKVDNINVPGVGE